MSKPSSHPSFWELSLTNTILEFPRTVGGQTGAVSNSQFFQTDWQRKSFYQWRDVNLSSASSLVARPLVKGVASDRRITVPVCARHGQGYK
jgi:hypothetical protein